MYSSVRRRRKNMSLPPCRGSNGSASSVDLRAGRGVGADNIIILGSLDRDWRGLWCGLEDRLPSGVEYLTYRRSRISCVVTD